MRKRFEKMTNYNRIGREYDATRRADPFLVSRLMHHLGGNRRGIYLDAACGTGNYTLALAKGKGGAWHGIDCPEQMIETARPKSRKVECHLADAAALPFAAEFFDGAICTLAIHHFENLPRVRRAKARAETGLGFRHFHGDAGTNRQLLAARIFSRCD